MGAEVMDKFHTFKVGELEMVEKISMYPNETVEHLVNQLIKLQQEYDNKGYNQGLGSKSEITIAMKSINKALKSALQVEGE